MAVISSNDGSSGPHIDFYSVFIIQIDGKKEWQLEKEIKKKNRDLADKFVSIKDLEN